jgi:hypothetical protein
MRIAVPVYGESPGRKFTGGGGWELLSGHRPARRRPRDRRAARIATPLGVPMALGLTLGIILALSGGNGTHIDQSSSTGSSPAPPRASAVPAQRTVSPAASCEIIVPADPLSARGLSTPYQLTGPSGASPASSGCAVSGSQGRAGLVRATILDPATGALAVYTPLVITQGTSPPAGPAVPTLPPGAIVTIDVDAGDFGSGATNLTLAGAAAGALAQGHCVSGGSAAGLAGTVSSCNGAAFFRAALALMQAGRLRVPAAGTSANMVATGGRLGTARACPNVRNFEVAGQDQDVSALVDAFLDPALGCQPFTAPDLADQNAPATSLALDELLAAGNEPRVAALVPENAIPASAGGQPSVARTDVYRAELGQPAVSARNDQDDSPAAYCQNMVNIATPFLAANQDVLAAAPAPAGKNLLTFLASRLSTSFGHLGCGRFGLTDPVTVVRDGAGEATSASFDTSPQQATASGGD